MLAYVHRWAKILVAPWSQRIMPKFVYRWVAWSSRVYTERQLGRVFPRLESVVKQIPPRPWLAIHGEKDSYIGPEIAADLVRRTGAGAPTELWVVPRAKHNRCREADPEGYRRRVAEFFTRSAPRVVRPAAVETVSDSNRVVRARREVAAEATG
jgi:pimeloyl-ACP methyl ester carboxylesterase